MKVEKLIATRDDEPIYAFIDKHGHTIAQAVGESAARALKKYLDEKVY